MKKQCGIISAIAENYNATSRDNRFNCTFVVVIVCGLFYLLMHCKKLAQDC